MRPFKVVRVTAGIVQCGIAGAWFALAWWLASYIPTTPNFLFRYALDGLVGFLAISAVLYVLITLAGLRTE